MKRQGSSRLCLLLMIAGLAGGCGTHHVATAPSSQKGGTREPTAVRVVLREYRFDPNPLKVAAGKVRFVLMNRGTIEHDFLIAGVTEHAHETHLIAPGQSRVIDVNLTAGAYEAICTVAGHKEAGMKVAVEVGVEAGSPAGH